VPGALQLDGASLWSSGGWQARRRGLRSLRGALTQLCEAGLREGVVGALRFQNSHANTSSLSFWLGKMAATVACCRVKNLHFTNFCSHLLSAFLQIFVVNLKMCMFV